jgi:NAD(P)-dependent dehydrogenase (short-subunit alcohol dehydrogenase family)
MTRTGKQELRMASLLRGKVALVAGATRGAGRGIALSLAEAGATVWCTGRSTRSDARRGAGLGQPFELALRPETIEQTAELARARGGSAIAVRVDHTDEQQVADLVRRIEDEHARLDILVNDIWGGDELTEWGKPYWELSPTRGFTLVERVLRTHFITSRLAVPLMLAHSGGLVVEITDGDFLGYRSNVLYDLAKMVPMRLAFALMADLSLFGRRDITSVALSPGFLRSEAMLDHFGVSEQNWREAIATDAHFAESETPHFVGRAVVALAADPQVNDKTGRVLSSGQLADEYDFDDIDGRRPHFQRHFDRSIAQMLDRGGPRDEAERGLLFARYFQLALDPRQLEWTRRMAAALGLPDPHPYPN